MWLFFKCESFNFRWSRNDTKKWLHFSLAEGTSEFIGVWLQECGWGVLIISPSPEKLAPAGVMTHKSPISGVLALTDQLDILLVPALPLFTEPEEGQVSRASWNLQVLLASKNLVDFTSWVLMFRGNSYTAKEKDELFLEFKKNT